MALWYWKSIQKASMQSLVVKLRFFDNFTKNMSAHIMHSTTFLENNRF